jgi:hypothetical protein
MGRKRKQGIQLLKNLTIEDLMESEGDESPLADLRSLKRTAKTTQQIPREHRLKKKNSRRHRNN